MENLLNDVLYANKHMNNMSDTDENIFTLKQQNVDQESEIENGNLLDYLEIFGFKENID